MKISYHWLKSYLNIDVSVEEVSEILTACGLEVESLETYESVKGGLRGVVTGEVLTCEKHPNADKLSLTKVDTGGGSLLDIVCGAPNVAAGQKVAVATIGTVLWFGDKPLEIKAATIRGAKSEGMICAEDELGLGTSHAGIMVLSPETPVGLPVAELFNVVSDTVFEIGLTPNRGDATSHLGVARDLAAVVAARDGRKVELNIPDVDAFKIESQFIDISVRVDDTLACPRYSGVCLDSIVIGESPDWLKHRLLAAGMRPINNVVDVTNFVMLECGQPLHAFDLRGIKGNTVVVRKAAEGTRFVTLDEADRNLSHEDLMICNSEHEMCIAGVFGGLNASVNESTTAIFLESAFFHPVGIRKTAKRHNLKTDSGFRFERGADPEITLWALKRATLILKEIAGARVCSSITDVYPVAVQPKEVKLRFARLALLTGASIPSKTVISILQSLGFQILSETTEELLLKVPTSKTDVTREADVIEEVLRIYGYNNVAFSEQMKSSISLLPRPDTMSYRNTADSLLTAEGFYEAWNVSLSNSDLCRKYYPESASDIVMLLNPLSRELDCMRISPVFNALENIRYNLNRKQNNLKFFEFGKVYKRLSAEYGLAISERFEENAFLCLSITGKQNSPSWEKAAAKTDVFALKAALEKVLRRFGIDSYSLDTIKISDTVFDYAQAGLAGKRELYRFGSISEALRDEFEIKQEVFVAWINWDVLMQLSEQKETRFSELSKYPEVRRDLALVIDRHVQYDRIRELVFESAGKLLREVNLFDVYEGDKMPDGKKSYAISLVLSHPEKTLTDKETDALMQNVIAGLAEKCGAVLR
jgi:phenylalanyl-tRNA synthetase beta chain